MDLNEYQRKVSEGGHSMNANSPCPACGDMDGCHVPARIREEQRQAEKLKVDLRTFYRLEVEQGTSSAKTSVDFNVRDENEALEYVRRDPRLAVERNAIRRGAVARLLKIEVLDSKVHID